MLHSHTAQTGWNFVHVHCASMFMLGFRCAIFAHNSNPFWPFTYEYWIASTAATEAKFIRFDCNQKKLSSTLALISPRQTKWIEIQTVTRISHLANQLEIKLHQLCVYVCSALPAALSSSWSVLPSFSHFWLPPSLYRILICFLFILGFNYFNIMCLYRRFILGSNRGQFNLFILIHYRVFAKAN